MINLIILGVVIIACLAIAAWAARSTGIVIPEPVRIILIAAAAILAILFLVALVQRSGWIAWP